MKLNALLRGANVINHGISANGNQRYYCESSLCKGKSFQLEYNYTGCKVGINERIIAMAANASEVQGTARVLGVSQAKVMFTLKNKRVDKPYQLAGGLPKHFFKSITFDCGKEFSNWKSLSNRHDIDIYFADPGTPSQRGLNENSNGLLRRGRLPKKMDFNEISEESVARVVHRRNNTPRKSLNYKTPIEYMTEHINQLELSRLI